MFDLPIYIEKNDKRCEYIEKSFTNKGYRLIESKENQKCVAVFSPSKLIEKKDIDCLKDKSVVFGGRVKETALEYMKNQNINFYNVLEDLEFVYLNTIPTAEGCIKLVIENTTKNICDLKILVLGYGRVAKKLCDYFEALKGNTYVFSINEDERASALVKAKGTLKTIKNISEFDVIINTVPAKLLSKKDMDKISKTCFVCDLASDNYVDIEYLKSIGINAIKAPGLPGKISPESASLYYERFINKKMLGKERIE